METPPTYTPLALPDAGRLLVTSFPSGATVYLGGRRLGQAPLSVTDLEPGRYEVTLQKEGYARQRLHVAVAPHRTSTVEGHLIPGGGGSGQAAQRVAGAEDRGTVQVLVRARTTSPETGETRLGEAEELFTTTLPPGRRRLTVEHPELGRKVVTVDVRPGEMHRIVVGFDVPPHDP